MKTIKDKPQDRRPQFIDFDVFMAQRHEPPTAEEVRRSKARKRRAWKAWGKRIDAALTDPYWHQLYWLSRAYRDGQVKPRLNRKPPVPLGLGTRPWGLWYGYTYNRKRDS